MDTQTVYRRTTNATKCFEKRLILETFDDARWTEKLLAMRHGQSILIGSAQVCRDYAAASWTVISENGETATIEVRQ